MAHKLDNLIHHHKVVVLADDSEASNKTHNLLVSFQTPFHKKDPDFYELSEATWRKHHHHETRPAIFIKGKFIGGYDQLDELNQSNKLKDLLA